MEHWDAENISKGNLMSVSTISYSDAGKILVWRIWIGRPAISNLMSFLSGEIRALSVNKGKIFEAAGNCFLCSRL